MRKETINALIEVIESLKGYAYHRGSGPFFDEDREASEKYTNKAIEKFKEEIKKEKNPYDIEL